MPRFVLVLAACAVACDTPLELPRRDHGSLNGRVVAGGLPRPGARVRLERIALEVLAGPDGTFHFARVPLGVHAATCTFDEDADGRDDLAARSSDVELRVPGEERTFGDVELRANGSAAGEVVSDDGPVGGAFVYRAGLGGVVVADAQGRFVVRDLPAGAVRLFASAPGYMPADGMIDVPSGGMATGLRIVLARTDGGAGLVTGTALDASGIPVRAIARLALSGVPRAETTADADGRFQLGPVEPGLYALTLEAGPLGHVVAPLPIGAGTLELGTLWLSRRDGAPPSADTTPRPSEHARTGVVTGRAVAGGHPVSFAEVTLAGTAHAVRTIGDGTFRLLEVPLGTHTLEARRDVDEDGTAELAARVTGVVLGIATPSVALGDIALGIPGTITGRVVAEADDTPVAGARVFIPGSPIATRTDRDGTFTLAGLTPGAAGLAVAATGFLPARREVVASADGVVETGDIGLQSDPGTTTASLSLRVLDTAGTPLEAATATVFVDDTPYAERDADAAGAITFDRLPTGLVSLRVDAPSHATLRRPTVLLLPGPNELGALVLLPGSADPDGPGEPLPGEPPPSIDAPRDLLAVASDARVSLSWRAPATGADTYVVYRSHDAAPEPVPLNAGSPATATTYADGTVTNYVAYRYRVVARRGERTSSLEASPVVQATPGPGTVVAGVLDDASFTRARSPYVVVSDDLVVPSGGTLTIEPGVELRFAAGRRLRVEGTLVARGSPTAPITFRPLDGNGWGGLVFAASSTDHALDTDGSWRAGCVLSDAIVRGSTSTGITIDDASPLLERVEIHGNKAFETVTSSYGGGLRIGAGARPLIRSCDIHDNEAGVLENDTTSVQWGAGIWSEGEPVLVGNTIRSNRLLGTEAGHSTNRGAGLYLAAGRAIVSGNVFTSNAVAGSGQANAAQTIRTDGQSIWIGEGTHLVANNRIEHTTVSNGTPHVFRGHVFIQGGTLVLLHNRFDTNAVTNAASVAGLALCAMGGRVEAAYNVVNAQTHNVPTTQASAFHFENIPFRWRWGSFTANHTSREISNVNTAIADLSDNHFDRLGTIPLSGRIYNVAAVDVSRTLDAAPAGVGPRPCAGDDDCATLPGRHVCAFAGCLPACHVEGCGPTSTCVPETGSCSP